MPATPIDQPELDALPDDADTATILTVDYIVEVRMYAAGAGKSVQDLKGDRGFPRFEIDLYNSILGRAGGDETGRKVWANVQAWYKSFGFDLAEIL